MDLIYANKNHIEQGILKNYKCDFDVADTLDFQIDVGITNNNLQGGYYWYIPDTEFGGRIDKYNVITDNNTIEYYGRSYRGLLASKIISPPANQDYKVVNGNVAGIIRNLLRDCGYNNMYVVDDNSLTITEYKFNRYTTVYQGIIDLLSLFGYVPNFIVDKNGIVHISISQPVDYTDDNEYTVDDVNFSIEKNYANVNHLICLGGGELKNRTVVNLYVDANGNIGETQTFTGEDEYIEIYDYPNAEDREELKQGGIERLKELSANDNFEVTLINDKQLHIGDIVGGVERVTNTYVYASIVNIIATITDDVISLDYKVGTDSTNSGSSAVSRKSTNNSVLNNDTVQATTGIAVNANETSLLASTTATQAKTTANDAKQQVTELSAIAITTNNLYAQSIDAGQITTGTLSADRIDSDAIATKVLESETLETEIANIADAQIQSATIGNAQITDLDVSKLTGGTIDVSHIDTDSITADVIDSTELSTKIATISDAEISKATITDAQISSINGNKITDGTILAKALSNDAIETISGTKVYYTANAPTEDLKNGDVWYKTVVDATSGDKWSENVSVWNGSAWVETPLDAKMFRANSITAQEIASNTITATEIDVDSLGADEAFIDKLFAQDIEATGTITGATLIGGSFESESDYYGKSIHSGGDSFYISNDKTTNLPSLDVSQRGIYFTEKAHTGGSIGGSIVFQSHNVDTGENYSGAMLGIEGLTFSDSYSGFTKSHNDLSIVRANILEENGERLEDKYLQIADASTVATSGSYNDLSNKPTIPTNTNQLTNGAGFITSSGSCASATKATQDGSGNNIVNTYAKKPTYSGNQNIDNKACANNTLVNVVSFTLDEGLYLVFCNAQFTSNANGYRQLGLSTSATSSNIDRFSIVRVGACSGDTTNIQLTKLLYVTAKTTYYVNVRQNSGSKLACYAGYVYTKIN